MPDSYDDAKGWIVQGARDGNLAFLPEMSPDSFNIWDGSAAYTIQRHQMPEGLRPFLELLTADDDGDGVHNVFDNFDGFDDNTTILVAITSTQKMAKLADNVYAAFNNDGDRISPYMKMTGSHTSTGNEELGFGFSATGANLYFVGSDRIAYDFETIPTPTGFPQ